MVRRFRGEGHPQGGWQRAGCLSRPHFAAVLEAVIPHWSEGKAPEFIIVYGDQRRDYLECFTIDAANEVDAKIDRLPRGSIERRASGKAV